MLPAAKDLLPIAQVLKSYGTEGRTIVSFLYGVPDEIDGNEPVFLFFEGLPVPFFIETLERKGNNKAQVKFEDVDSLEQAEEIVGKEVFKRRESADEESDEDGLCAEDLIGFTLKNQYGKAEGIIEDIQDFSGNICLTLPGDRLIPFHEDLIISIDESSKIITLTIPEGI